MRFLARALAKMVGIRPIVITGPSGTGKSTIFNKVMNENPNTFAFSVSRKLFFIVFFKKILVDLDTTRKPREGEVEGVHYYFVEKERMLKMIENDEFIEHAQFGGNKIFEYNSIHFKNMKVNLRLISILIKTSNV